MTRQYRFDAFTFDPERGSLHSDQGEHTVLRHKVANLLHYLLQHADRVVSKEELLAELWTHGDYRENSLTQSIRELRQALGDSAQSPRYIRTFNQRGYQFIGRLTAADTNSKNEPSPGQSMARQTWRPSLLFTLLLGGALALLISALMFWRPASTPVSPSGSTLSLLVLPFINATGESQMTWLELGLADMIAIDLKRQQKLSVTPPAQAQSLLLDSGLPWPTLPVHIRTLLNDQQQDAALFASVRLHNQQQVLDFQLIYRDGRIQQGAISYPSLPAESLAISQQLLALLRPQHAEKHPAAATDPIAAQALAQGMQALRQQGAVRARPYFQASLTIEPDSHWARAWLVRALLNLGEWQQAAQQLAAIPASELDNDLSLKTFALHSRAQLASWRGDSNSSALADQALHLAQQTSDPELISQSLQLKAQQAWDAMDWLEHQRLLQQASQQTEPSADMQLRADQLFYLGNPSNSGLEKSPLNDLDSNRLRLEKALNFYRQLNNQPQIAATELAIAQNYRFPLDERSTALAAAIAAYRTLEQPYDLAQALIYGGFFQLQLHRGDLAQDYFQEAAEIARQLGATPLISLSELYLGFASLDQGLDQSSLGRHGQHSEYLHKALQQFQSFIDTAPTELYLAHARFFRGWALADLARTATTAERSRYFAQALDELQQAQMHYQTLQMPTSIGYSNYSILWIYLQQQQYDKAVQAARSPDTTRLQARYLARAYYEQQKPEQARQVLEEFHKRWPQLWQEDDTQRLRLYQQGDYQPLPPEPLPHLVYCESDWLEG